MTTFRNLFGSLYFKMSLSFIVIIIVLVASVSTATSLIFLGKYRNELQQKNSLILNQLKENVDQFILEAADKMITYSILTDADTMKLFRSPVEGNELYIQQANARITQLVNSNPLYHSIYIYYKNNGLVVSNYGTYYLTQKVNRVEEFRWLSEGGAKVGGKWTGIRRFKPYPTVSDSEARDVIAYLKNYPFGENASNNLGTIAVTIDYNRLFMRMKNMTNSVFGQIYILDASGNVMYDNANKRTFQHISLDPELDQVLRGGGTPFQEIEQDGQPMMVFTTKSQTNDWSYVNVVPMAVLQQQVASVKGIAIQIALIAILVFIVISLFWANKLYRPIGQLVQRTKQITRELLLTDPNGAKDDRVLDLAFHHLVLKIGELQNKIVIDEPKIKNSVLIKLFEHKYSLEEEIEQDLQRFQIRFPFPGYYCLCIRVSGRPEESEVVLDTVRSNLVYYIEHVDAIDCVKLATDALSGYVVALVNAKEKATVVKFAKELIEYGAQRFETKLVVGIGEGRDRLIDVGASYNGARNALKYTFLQPEEPIAHEAAAKERDRLSQSFPAAYSDKWEKALNEGNLEATEDCLGNIFHQLERKEYSFQTVQRQLIQLTSILQRKQKGAEEGGPERIPDFTNPTFAETGSLRDIRDLLLDACRETVLAIKDQRVNRTSIELDQMQQYIESLVTKGRSEEITLNEVAEQFNKNPNYLSRLFSEGVGVTFKDYVVNLKLERAKEALNDPDVKIKDVAKEMGYENTSYFIRIFKRKYGCTPKEYIHQIHSLKEDA